MVRLAHPGIPRRPACSPGDGGRVPRTCPATRRRRPSRSQRESAPKALSPTAGGTAHGGAAAGPGPACKEPARRSTGAPEAHPLGDGSITAGPRAYGISRPRDVGRARIRLTMDGHTSVEAGGRPCRGRDDRGRAADLTADRIGTRPPIPPGSERARPPSGLLAADRTTFNPGALRRRSPTCLSDERARPESQV